MFGVNWKIWESNISLNYQFSEFKDITSFSSSLIGESAGARFARALNKVLSLNAGVSYSRLTDVDTNSTDLTISPNIGITYKLIPDKLVLSGLSNFSYGTNTANTRSDLNSDINIEATYQLTKESGLTLMTEWIGYSDFKDPTFDYLNWRIGTRISYSF